MEPTRNQPTSRGCATQHDVSSRASGVPENVAPVSGKATSRLAADVLRRREEAVRFADASIGLEGFVVSAAEKVRADHFIAGEIDLAAFLNGR
jgi:hypothetical protein